MINLEIYIVGGIDFLMPVFRALVTFLGGSAIGSFVKLFVLSGLLFAIWISIFGRDRFFFLKHFFMAVILVNLAFAPIVNLTIIDTKYNKVETVSNFPFLPGLFLSIGSVSADFFTNAIDSLFHAGTTIVWSGGSGSYLADLDYRNTGFLGSMDIMRRTLSFRLRKVPEFNTLQNMLYHYIENCFFPYLATINNNDQLKDILTSKDLFPKIRVNGYLIEYNGSVYTCGEFYDNELAPRWNNLKNKLSNNPEIAGFIYRESQIVSGTLQALTMASYSFQDAITQAGLINAISYVLSAQNIDDYTLLSAYISGRAQEQSKMLWRGLGTFMADTLPKVRNYIIAIAVFFSFMLIPMMLLPFFGRTPGSVLIGFAKFIGWAWFWDPMLALLDAGTKIMAIQKTTAWLANQNLDGISIATLAELVNDAEWYPAVAGYIAIAMVPTLSWLFFRGFDAGISGIAYMFGNIAGGVREEFSRMSQNIQRDYLGSLTGELNSGTWAWYESMYKNVDSLSGIYAKEELIKRFGGTVEYAVKKGEAQAIIEEQQIGRGMGIGGAANKLNVTPLDIGTMEGYLGTAKTVATHGAYDGDLQKMIQTIETEVRRQIGTNRAWRETAEKFGMSVDQFAHWMTAVELLRRTGDINVFENYLKQHGLEGYVRTRLLELLNETAKMDQKYEVAAMLGYIDAYDFERGMYEYFRARHASDNQFTLVGEMIPRLADWAERSGFGELAGMLREDPDGWVGATVRFGYADGRIGEIRLSRGSDVLTFTRFEDKVVMDREYVFNPGDISMVRTDPDRFSSDTAQFIYSAYIRDSEEGLVRSKAALIDYLTKQVENYIQKQREISDGVNIQGGVDGRANQLLHTLIGMMERAGFGKSRIGAILQRAGIAAETVAGLMKGGATARGEALDRKVIRATRFVVEELADRLYDDIENMRRDGDLTGEEILGAAKRFTEDISSFIGSAESTNQANKAGLAAQRFKSAGGEALKVFGDEAALGAAGILLANLGPELAAKGADVFKRLKEKLGPEDFRKVLRELDEFRGKLTSEVESRFGKGTARYVDDFLKAVGKEVIEGGRSIKEAVETAKDTAAQNLVSRGLPHERAERIVNRIMDVAGDVVDDAKSGWRSLFRNIFSVGGLFGGVLLDPQVIHPEMDMIKLHEFQKEYGLRYDFRSRTFTVEDPVKFAPLAESLGISSYGELSPDENKRLMSAYWTYVRTSN